MKKTDAEQLFHKNINLAYYILHKHYTLSAQDEDLKQEALLGLWKACMTFDPSKAQFSTYAIRCILNQINMYYRKESNKPLTVSLNAPVGEDGLTMEDVLEDPCPSIDEGLIDLKTYLAGLTDEERKIIQLNVEGFTQQQIGDKMGKSQAWCSHMLRRLRQNYQEQEEQE